MECSRFWGPNLLAAAPKARVNPNPAANPKVPKPTLATPEGIMQAAKMVSFKALLNGPSDAIDVYLVPTKRAETATQSTAGTQASVEAPSQQGNSAPKESVSSPGNAIGPSANVQPPLVAGQTPQGQPPNALNPFVAEQGAGRNPFVNNPLVKPGPLPAAVTKTAATALDNLLIGAPRAVPLTTLNSAACWSEGNGGGASLDAVRSASWSPRHGVGAPAAGELSRQLPVAVFPQKCF